MAAYAALLSLTRIIGDIENHHSPPISLDEQQAQSFIERVSFLQRFLEGYTSHVVDIDDEADPLEMRIADAAYAAEDVIESHIKLMTRSGEENEQEEEMSMISCINLYEDLHQVIEEMNLIKKVAVNIDNPRQRNVSASSSDASVRREYSSYTGYKNTCSMVCSDEVLHGIMEKLAAGRRDFQVIPIVGMSGIGKTTLARNIYTQPLITEYFDICIWATISQQYNRREIICELLSRKGVQSEKSDDELGLELYQYLYGRRFLIVMDDMWSIDAWEDMHRFFPNIENGSRVLVTTRLSQLSSQLNKHYSLEMQFMDEVSGWTLFSKTVFGETANCPLELEKIGKEIVENCRGLPLSIIVVGGILKKMEDTRACWESIRNNLTSVVNLENDKHCLRLLKMSYDHLPVYLKPCFLYMGVFEEDERILVSRLIKLWICEGLVKPMKDKSLEAIAKIFLKELVDRNLVLINGLGSTGNVKCCKIHDLVRDLCLRESKKYGFYLVVEECSSHQDMHSQRRVVIRKDTSKSKIRDALRSMSRTRSVICGAKKVPSCRSFGLLRTLEAHDNRSNIQSYVNGLVFECVNLRHLSADIHTMPSFISSINVFWNLHTLIIYCWNECNAPVGIWKMPQLRHIEVNGKSLWLPDPPSDGDGGDDEVVVMKNLEILKGVRNCKYGKDVVKRIMNLKKLGIRYRGNGGGGDYCLSNIESLCRLESLNVIYDCDLMLTLTFPLSLKNLHLRMNETFEWEEMLKKIGSLPSLQKLKLYYGCFRTGKWEMVEDQFPSLIHLKVKRCRDLKHWTAQDNSIFPQLEQLHLNGLHKLKEIPCEIGDIPTLEKVELVDCSESAVLSAKEMLEEQVALQGEQFPFYLKVRVSHKNVTQQSFYATKPFIPWSFPK